MMFLLLTAVASRTAHSSKHGNAKDKQNLAEIFRPPHDILFTGTFHEVHIGVLTKGDKQT